MHHNSGGTKSSKVTPKPAYFDCGILHTKWHTTILEIPGTAGFYYNEHTYGVSLCYKQGKKRCFTFTASNLPFICWWRWLGRVVFPPVASFHSVGILEKFITLLSAASLLSQFSKHIKCKCEQTSAHTNAISHGNVLVEAKRKIEAEREGENECQAKVGLNFVPSNRCLIFCMLR